MYSRQDAFQPLTWTDVSVVLLRLPYLSRDSLTSRCVQNRPALLMKLCTVIHHEGFSSLQLRQNLIAIAFVIVFVYWIDLWLVVLSNQASASLTYTWHTYFNMVEIPDLEDLKKMKVPELNDLCKQLGIDTKVSCKIAFPPSFGWIRRLFEDSSYKCHFIAPVQSIRLHQVRVHMRSMHQSTSAPLAIAMTVTICQPDLGQIS